MSSRTDTAALRTFLAGLLEKGIADAVFALRRTPAEGRFCYSLVSDPAIAGQVLEPFHPVMPVQGAKALASLTSEGPVDRRIVALLRPCELRACIELQKQEQLSMENVTVLSCSCPGVIPAKTVADEEGGRIVREYRESVGRGEEPAGIRDACTVCGSLLPVTPVSMTFVLASDGGAGTGSVCLGDGVSPEIRDLLAGCGIPVSDRDAVDLAGGMLEARTARRNAFVGSPAFGDGLDGLVSHFSGCTGCGGCRAACPVCSCVLCTYVSDRSDLASRTLRLELGARGAARVPSGTTRFHMGRLNHISAYCAACGQCSEACPAGIDVAGVFIRAAGRVQDLTGYRAGADESGDPLLATFTERELEDVTDR